MMISNVSGYVPLLQAGISHARRSLAALSPQLFAMIYMRAYLSRPPSRMHKQVLELLCQASGNRGCRIAIAAPRGHAKTTLVSLAYVLWSAIYRREMFILLISATREQAVGLLKNVKEQIQSNDLLRQDFPSICYRPGDRPVPKPWRDHQIVLSNHVCIRALGANQGLRGMRHNEHRPSLVILDDLESQELVTSAEQRQKTRDWFEKTLLKAGDPSTNILVIGTVLHQDSLLASLLEDRPGKSTGWTSRKYQAIESFSTHPELWDQWEAILNGGQLYQKGYGRQAALKFYENHKALMDEGTGVLWPELEGYYQLMLMRACEGRISFQSEKQNEPIDPATCIFREEHFRYWDKEQHKDVAELIQHLGPNVKLFGACDPSLGKKGVEGDYTAIVILIQERTTKVAYVIVADIARRSPDQVIEQIIAYGRMYGVKQFAVESNQFQQMLADELAKRAKAADVRLDVNKVNHSTDKKARIQSLEPYIGQGQIRFSMRQQMLLEQLRQFPHATYDDGPDALEMAASMAFGPDYSLKRVDWRIAR
jgi:predicted phage terminase large subunit-like protein